jgi:Tol biopolymer transport system component
MSAIDGLERDVELWLTAEAPTAAPDGLHETAIRTVRRTRQHPRWAVTPAGPRTWARPFARPTTQVFYLLLVLGLAVVVAVAAMVGAIRKPANPLLGRNGMIAYAAATGGAWDDIHLVNANGSSDHVLIQGWCPTFSVDGRTLAYLGYGPHTPTLYLSRSDGSSPRAVASFPQVSFLDEGPVRYPGSGSPAPMALSPDGTRFAWFQPFEAVGTSVDPHVRSVLPDRTREIWLSTVDGAAPRRLVPPPGDPDLSYGPPVWSPDSRFIALAIMRTVRSADAAEIAVFRDAIDIIDVDTGEVRHITTRPGGFASSREISWSPDSRAIVYAGLPDGSPLPSFTTPSSDQPDPYLATEPHDVFAIGVDGSSDRNITASPDDEEQPRWSPDGSRIAYLVGSHAAIITIDHLERIGTPTIGPSANQFVWSPDGSMLLATYFTREPTPQDPVGHVLRWIDASFQRSPVDVEGRGFNCLPSWQRLAP